MTRENIEHASNELIAEWMEQHAAWMMSPWKENPRFKTEELVYIYIEAARRLRTITAAPFNDEQFSI